MLQNIDRWIGVAVCLYFWLLFPTSAGVGEGRWQEEEQEQEQGEEAEEEEEEEAAAYLRYTIIYSWYNIDYLIYKMAYWK